MFKTLLSAAAALLLATSAHAVTTTTVVDAIANSYNGGSGTGDDTFVSLTAGQSFSVTVGANDLWSSGAVPRWSNADGLNKDLYAVAGDESGQAATTLIGKNWGLYGTADGAFYFGELVGKIGNGAYFAVGTNFNNTANATGILRLFYWDSNSGDNEGAVTASISAVPETGSFALMLAGLGIVGGLARRRARKAA